MAVKLSQFVDIHVHILPGIDDGPKTLGESVAMAKAYVNIGVNRIIATPHFIPGTAWAAGRACIADKLKELNDFFIGKDIPLTIFPGMEIAYHGKLINRLKTGMLQPLGTSKVYLLEPSFGDSSNGILECASLMIASGRGVILAHPERIPSFQDTAERLVDLVGQGLLVQVNIGSLMGNFGESSKNLAMYLIEKSSVHFLASDSHAATGRCPPNFSDWEVLRGLLGDDLLTRLCVTNPCSLIKNN